MSEVAKESALMTVPRGAYQMQQNMVRQQEVTIGEQAARIRELERGVPGDSAALAEATQEVSALRAELEAARAALAVKATLPTVRRIPMPTMKVSKRKAMSVYGLGRFPVTLYKEQWFKLLDMAEDIRSFMDEHASELSTKEENKAA